MTPGTGVEGNCELPHGARATHDDVPRSHCKPFHLLVLLFGYEVSKLSHLIVDGMRLFIDSKALADENVLLECPAKWPSHKAANLAERMLFPLRPVAELGEAEAGDGLAFREGRGSASGPSCGS